MSDTYVCSVCKQRYAYEWTDEEALAETAEVFGEEALSVPLDIVCDDCWRDMMGLPPNPPRDTMKGERGK